MPRFTEASEPTGTKFELFIGRFETIIRVYVLIMIMIIFYLDLCQDIVIYSGIYLPCINILPDRIVFKSKKAISIFYS